jgi:hypothetical protein
MYTFLCSELCLEQNKRSDGRSRFRFLVNDDPVFSNYKFLLYYEKTAAAISA